MIGYCRGGKSLAFCANHLSSQTLLCSNIKELKKLDTNLIVNPTLSTSGFSLFSVLSPTGPILKIAGDNTRELLRVLT